MNRILLTSCALLLTVGCTSKTTHDNSTSSHALSIDPATVATISGSISFQGFPPQPQKIDMSQDPACGPLPNFDPSLVVTNGQLANVFVYVKDVLYDVAGPAPAKPVVITQKGCRYQPHVAAALIGQPVFFENADPTTHNVHMMPTGFKQWNESQLPSAPPIEKHFDRPEVMIPIKCNQHPWMRMYLNVIANPFFAITGPDGKFAIAGFPPGTYTIAAVHERLGEQDVRITIGPKESKTTNFVFKEK